MTDDHAAGDARRLRFTINASNPNVMYGESFAVLVTVALEPRAGGGARLTVACALQWAEAAPPRFLQGTIERASRDGVVATWTRIADLLDRDAKSAAAAAAAAAATPRGGASGRAGRRRNTWPPPPALVPASSLMMMMLI